MTFDWGILASVLGGGALGGLGTWIVNLKKEKTNTFKVLLYQYRILYEGQEKRLAEMEVRLNTVEKENDDLEQKIVGYKLEVQNLKNQLILLEGSHFDLPLPMWFKNKEGVMVFCNKNYEEMFLEPLGLNANDYIGKTDHEIWSKEVADSFVKNDKKVIRSKKQIQEIEEVSDGSGNTFKIEVLKYPRILNNQIIGVSGIVLRTID